MSSSFDLTGDKLSHYTANRTLEDMDAYYRTNPPVIVSSDPEATSTKRSQGYV